MTLPQLSVALAVPEPARAMMWGVSAALGLGFPHTLPVDRQTASALTRFSAVLLTLGMVQPRGSTFGCAWSRAPRRPGEVA